MTIQKIYNKAAQIAMGTLLAYSLLTSADAKMAKDVTPLWSNTGTTKLTAAPKKEAPKAVIPTVITVQSKDSLESILGDMNSTINNYEEDIKNKEKEAEDLKSGYKAAINKYAGKLDSMADKLKDSANLLKGKMSEKKTEIIKINVNKSPIGAAGVLSYNDKDKATGYGANVNIYTPILGLIDRLHIEGVYTGSSKNLDQIAISGPLGNGFSYSGTTDTKRGINNFSLYGGIETGQVAGFSLTALAGAENDSITDSRTVTEKLLKNGNQMSYNSHQKVDGPKNVTGFKYGFDLNYKIDNFKVSVGTRLNKDGIKEYVVKVGGEF